MSWLMKFLMQDYIWSVGYFDPDGKWVGLIEFGTMDEAAAYINYLHGGAGIQKFDEKALGVPNE